MPSEILVLIFIFYLGLHNPATHCENPPREDPRSSYAPSQRSLTAVSARWRAILHSTPKLWTYIGFDFADFSKLDEQKKKCYAGRVDTLLHYSRDQPLNVLISLHIRSSQPRVSELGCIVIENLFAQSSRWRSATLLLGNGMNMPRGENPSRTLSIQWPSSFPQLESLHIGERSPFVILSMTGDPFLSAPNLKHLHIGLFEFQLQILRFPFSQIRALELPFNWSRQTVLHTLQAVPDLDYLRLTLAQDSKDFFAAPMQVFCRELVLIIYTRSNGRANFFSSDPSCIPFDPCPEISQFFERVQFVGMKSMTLGAHEAHWTTAQIDAFLQSMQPSMSDLTCLTLEHLVFKEKALVSLLSLLPSLQTLCVLERYLYNDNYPIVREAFFGALTVQAKSSETADGTTLDTTSPVIIPQLKELALQIISHSFTFEDLLVDMVCSRPRLRSLELKSQASQFRDRMKPVQEMVEDLKLRLSCRPDLRIQGRKWEYGVHLELRSIHRS
jgi:hypothetical protein